jgi:hypothetical protein
MLSWGCPLLSLGVPLTGRALHSDPSRRVLPLAALSQQELGVQLKLGTAGQSPAVAHFSVCTLGFRSVRSVFAPERQGSCFGSLRWLCHPEWRFPVSSESVVCLRPPRVGLAPGFPARDGRRWTRATTGVSGKRLHPRQGRG